MKPVAGQTGARNQDGFLLLGVLFMTLLILLALAVAAPKMAQEVRRDKEVETVHRGLQYARAIRMFYTKYGRYPSKIDDLIKTQDQRFLRKRYLDPMTGKDDWRIIHLGEAKVGPMGLFGQPMQNTNGITPTGASTGLQAGATTGSSPFGSSSGSSFGSSSFGSSSSGNNNAPFGSSPSSPTGTTGSSPFGSSGTQTSTTGGTDSGTGSTFGQSTPLGGTTTTGQSSNTFGSPGVTVGGAPIVGVGLLSKKESIKVYKKQTHYNQWEFVFDPNQSALEATAGAGTNINGNGTGTNGTSNGFGSTTGSGFGSNTGSGFGSTTGSGFGSGGSGFGSGGSGFGNSPSAPVSPTSPVSPSPQ